MVKMNKEEFINALKNINIILTEEQIEKLDIYEKELLEYNKHTNLTALKTTEEVYLKHFYDSLTLSKIINFNDFNSLIDIGTGAGFPGIVLKIVYPNLNITLLDSNNKKTTFCEYIINKLNLTEIEVVNKRAEDYIKEKREFYDIVTARAVKELPILSELCIPFIKVDGYFLAMKGSSRKEIESSEYAFSVLNCNIEDTIHFNLPKKAGERTILKIKKNKKTDILYPRPYEKIIKKPLKK